ncbi:MAG: DUF4922 domain-containing protein [Planctomycetota bacterium]
MNHNYRGELHRIFDVSDAAKSLFNKIANASTEERELVLRNLGELRKDAGLGYALAALYRQQVNSGFVLADPLSTEGKTEKRFFDTRTNITFRLHWNPHRELRKNHALLVERGVVTDNVDETKLINRDNRGTPCYLCKTNIDEQNPGEILLGIRLAGEQFYAGANFAYITNNHFTIMNAEHRPQQYRPEIPEMLNGFVDETDGNFRVIFNGLAGATIEWHEHLQATTEKFPIEEIRIKHEDVVYRSRTSRVSRPDYYIPVWVVEGRNKGEVTGLTDRLIKAWHGLNERGHTENIIAAKSSELYRTFVILRDKSRLASDKAGKKGAMAAFETGGSIVLSYEPTSQADDINEKQTFKNARLETVRQLLKEISPDEQSSSDLLTQLKFANIGV